MCCICLTEIRVVAFIFLLKMGPPTLPNLVAPPFFANHHHSQQTKSQNPVKSENHKIQLDQKNHKSNETHKT